MVLRPDIRLSSAFASVPRFMASQNARLGWPLSGHDLDDLVQDTMLVLLGKAEHLDDPRPPGPWIYSVCRLEFLNGLRRFRRRAASLVDPLQLEAATSAGADEGRYAERELLHAAIDRVGGVEAEAIRLKHFEGLTFDEMGERLGVPASTLKTRHYKGMARLSMMLATAEEQS